MIMMITTIRNVSNQGVLPGGSPLAPRAYLSYPHDLVDLHLAYLLIHFFVFPKPRFFNPFTYYQLLVLHESCSRSLDPASPCRGLSSQLGYTDLPTPTPMPNALFAGDINHNNN